MKLSSEIARTKKVVFFSFSVSSMQTDKKKTEITEAEMTQCTRAEKEAFFCSDTRTQTHLHASAKTHFLNFQKPSVPTKTCQYLFSINTIHINFGGNCLVYVYHIALNKASENENEVKALN